MFKQLAIVATVVTAFTLAFAGIAPAQDSAGSVDSSSLVEPSKGGDAGIGFTAATVENSYFQATATASCSSRRINAKVTVISKKHNLPVKINSAGLYNGSGGLVTSTGMQGYPTPLYLGYLYAGAYVTWTWYATAPSGGRTVKFFVSSPNNVATVGVSASCTT